MSVGFMAEFFAMTVFSLMNIAFLVKENAYWNVMFTMVYIYVYHGKLKL